MEKLVVSFKDIRISDVEIVGGKNASLGEMISQLAQSGVRVPNGFATTANAYKEFLKQDGLATRIEEALSHLDVDNVEHLQMVGSNIRQWILDTPFQDQFKEEITEHYNKLMEESSPDVSFAIRSSATAEDLPDASFAGQQETFLNIQGLKNIHRAIKEVFASLYNDRAIAYRTHKGFKHGEVFLSAGIQKMVRSDLGSSGVMFTLDTESGFRDVVFITSSYGVGETVVQGSVNPDEFYVHKKILETGKNAIIRRTLGTKMHKMIFTNDKVAHRSTILVDVSTKDQREFSISDADVQELAMYANIIEKHYGRPMDIEWGKDGKDDKIYILQTRPETVKSREKQNKIEKFKLKHEGKVILTGRAIGQRIGSGTVRVVHDLSEMHKVQSGDILVTDMTDPNWEPIMKRASAIVTNRGGRTCHAAIIARELSIPAVVGCEYADEYLKEGQDITVSCADGDIGKIYEGKIEYDVISQDVQLMPPVGTKIMMNVGNPALAFEFAQIPNEGVGLARVEFIINNVIGIHPKAVLNIDKLDIATQKVIQEKSWGYKSPVTFFVDKLAEGVATIGGAFWPKPVIVRLSDFKSNEYKKLLGGNQYEPEEENPMLGFRGASRYISESFEDCFALECRAMKKVREEMGLTNIWLMIPFVRTLQEGKNTIQILKKYGLEQGVNDLKVIMMCEIPSNALLAEDFLDIFDGFSIGSNDLTQLTLGLDRDSGLVASCFDEQDPAVKRLLDMAIKAAKKKGKYVGICGQGPSDKPELAMWLMERGISSISLNPDTVIDTWLTLGNKK